MATYTVNSLADTNDNNANNGITTLREAIALANSNAGADTITFAGGVFADTTPDTITLTSLLPVVSGDLTITGTGANSLTISGNNQFQVFFINAGTVNLSALTIANGVAQGGNGGNSAGGGAGLGGGLLVNSGNVTVSNVVFNNNRAIGGNGGDSNGGGGGGGVGGNGGTRGVNGGGINGGIANSGGGGGGGGNFGGRGGDGGRDLVGNGEPGGNGGDGAGGGGGGSGLSSTTNPPGGGGSGGNGGFGGGGGSGRLTSGRGTSGGRGGNGGFGGGGGGGSPGSPGFSPGERGIGGNFGGDGGSGSFGGGAAWGPGGGGAGLGGAIFVRAGSLTLTNSTLTGNQAIAGAAGPGGVLGISGANTPGTPGQGKGGAIFINEEGSFTSSGLTFTSNSATNAGTTSTDNNNVFVLPTRQILGTAGNDVLVGTNLSDTINGLAGDDSITGNKEDDLLTGGNGRDTFVFNRTDGTDTITDFGGVGRGINPSAATLAEVDTIKFNGENFTARNLNLTQVGADLQITFNSVPETVFNTVVLQNFALENLDNLPAGTQGGVVAANLLFDGQTAPQDSFDVFDADSTRDRVFNRNTVTFLNDRANQVSGLDNSNDVINGQGGDDRLFGRSGDDLLRGNDGNDQLVGGAGNDTLQDNEGNNQFVYSTGRAFRTADLGVDTIDGGGFFLLSKRTFTALRTRAGQSLSANEFEQFFDSSPTGTATAARSRSHIVFNSATGELFYNANGSAPGFGSGGLLLLSTQSGYVAENFIITA